MLRFLTPASVPAFLGILLSAFSSVASAGNIHQAQAKADAAVSSVGRVPARISLDTDLDAEWKEADQVKRDNVLREEVSKKIVKNRQDVIGHNAVAALQQAHGELEAARQSAERVGEHALGLDNLDSPVEGARDDAVAAILEAKDEIETLIEWITVNRDHHKLAQAAINTSWPTNVQTAKAAVGSAHDAVDGLHQALVSTIEAREKRVEDIQRQVDEAEESLANHERRVEELERKLADVQKKARDAGDKNNDLVDEYESLPTSGTESEVVRANQRRKQILREIDDLTDNIAGFNEQITTLMGQIKEGRKAVNFLRDKDDGPSGELAEACGVLDWWKKELE